MSVAPEYQRPARVPGRRTRAQFHKGRNQIRPHFDQIEVELDALNEMREKLAGTVMINAPDYIVSGCPLVKTN